MGNPPRRLVLNKLIRRYFKRETGMVQSEEAMGYKMELVNCWEQHGVDHPKCAHLIAKYDKGWELDVIA